MRQQIDHASTAVANSDSVAVDNVGDAIIEAELADIDAPTTSARSGFAWGISGFVVGAAFWHLVGFWGFVEKIVYNGRPSDASSYVAQTGGDCVALELNRELQAVQKLPCSDDVALLDEVTHSVRGDFLGSRSGPLARVPKPLRLTSGEK